MKSKEGIDNRMKDKTGSEVPVLPVYKYVTIKDVKGDRYTYHDARTFMVDDLIHVYSDGDHIVFNKNDIIMFILKGYDPVDETDNLHECGRVWQDP